MSFIANIEQSVEHLGQFISGAFGKLVKELEPLAKSDVDALLAALLPDAVNIVSELATGQLSNPEKRQAAISALGAKASGIAAADVPGLLGAAVEIGLQIAAVQNPAVATSLAGSGSGAAAAAATPAPASGGGAAAPSAPAAQ